MRKFLVSAAIIGLVAALPPASAQDREHHDQGGQRHGEEHGGDQRGGAPHGGPQSQGGAAPAMQAPPGRGERGEMRDRDAGRSNFRAPSTAVQPNQPPPNAPTNTMRGPDRRFGSDNAMRGPEERRDNDRRGAAPNMAMQPNQPPPDNAMRGTDRRFGPNNGANRDFSGVRNFHQNFRAERRFRARAYIRPRGFYEHRWTWGETLPPLFWAQQYWIVDFEDYDLPPPPYGAIWVRVGDDALLVDRYNGVIIEVAYGVFY